MSKLQVFVIMPFDEELNDLYGYLRNTYEEKAEFKRADDFLNQQNILKDIVLPIFRADLIIADLTGLNANVFYELGLAHAFRKNVILITQDIGELPFDLRSYRVIEYSTHFARIKDLEDKLSRIINEFSSISFGSPVTDWITLDEQVKNLLPGPVNLKIGDLVEEVIDDVETLKNEFEEKGFLDFIADLEEAMADITSLVEQFSEKTTDIGETVNMQSAMADEITKTSGSASNLRKLARTIAQSMKEYGQFVSKNNSEYEARWNVIEDSLVNLINSPHTATDENREQLKDFISVLSEVTDVMLETRLHIGNMAESVKGLIGIEATISRAASLIFREVKRFEGLIDKSVSTIERVNKISVERELI